MRKKKPELKRYEFRARIEFGAYVVVEAANLEDARASANAGEWVSNELDGMVDWKILSEGREES